MKVSKRLKSVSRKDWFLPAVVLSMFVIVAASVVMFRQYDGPVDSLSKQPVFVYDCEDLTLSTIDCQQKYYSDLTATDGVPAAFKKLREAYPVDSAVKSNCHQITHAIGRRAAEENKTVEAAYDKGDNFCWSGYYHGVMETLAATLGGQKINDDMVNICESVKAKQKYSFYHFNCVHGLGHGLMAVNDNELFDVLELCARYPDQWEKESCQGGAYMENIMFAIQSGQEGKYLKNDKPMYPCDVVKDEYKQQCYLMQTSHALKVVDYDYQKVFDLCSGAENYDSVCYQSLGRDASGNSVSDVTQTRTTCMLGRTEYAQSNCFIGAVKDFISYYHNDQEADELCRSLESNLQGICQKTKEEYYAGL